MLKKQQQKSPHTFPKGHVILEKATAVEMAGVWNEPRRKGPRPWWR